MPLYEYLCDACAHRFEVIQKYSDPPISECPKCGGVVMKLFSSPAIQFKGSGFYITDYARKSDSATTPASGETKTESKSESKSEGKSESKSDMKSDSKSDSKPSTSES
jgi:putative FmdB family regulatory protein